MLRSRRVRWLIAAAATVSAAAAGHGQSFTPDERLFVRPEDQHTVLFASADIGRSIFVSGGSKQTLVGPLDRTGFALMEATGLGFTRERYRDGVVDVPALRLVQQAGLMAGHQWSLDRVFLAAFTGPEVHREQVTIGSRLYTFAQPRLGWRGQIELWSNPTPDTLVTSTVVAGTTRTYLWVRASGGLRALGSAFVGPEITAYVTPTYSELRVGAHVTGLAAGLVSLRVSGGWMTDEAHRRGSPYAGLTAWIRL